MESTEQREQARLIAVEKAWIAAIEAGKARKEDQQWIDAMYNLVDAVGHFLTDDLES